MQVIIRLLPTVVFHEDMRKKMEQKAVGVAGGDLTSSAVVVEQISVARPSFRVVVWWCPSDVVEGGEMICCCFLNNEIMMLDLI